MKSVILSFATAAVLAAAAGAGPVDNVAREGSGERRVSLNKLELQPFPADAWASLTDWQNGSAPTPEETDGKVVLICTWASWYPTSVKALPLAQRLAARFGEQGLVVVGAHDSKKWDGAAAAAAANGVTFRYAHDASGEFRKRLLVDQDPDFYVIDRAGQLRYADIETSAVEPAVAALVAETKEQSASILGTMAAEEAKRAEEARRSSLIKQNIDLAAIPELPFPAPLPEAYLKARWPQRWTRFEQDILGFQAPQQGQEATPIALSLPPPTDASAWFGPAPKLAGRAGVVYFYNPLPRHSESYTRIQPIMDRLQRAKGRDVNIVGVMTRYPASNNSTPNPEQEEKDRLEFARLAARAKTSRTYEHAQVVDADGALLNSIMGGQNNYNNKPPPYYLTAVVSTDGTVRWIGVATDSRFDAALEQVLREDPAVQARRKVEQEWIKAQGG